MAVPEGMPMLRRALMHRPFFLALSSWFHLPEHGMEEPELLSRSSATLVRREDEASGPNLAVVTAAHVLRPRKYYPDVEWLASLRDDAVSAKLEIWTGSGTLCGTVGQLRKEQRRAEAFEGAPTTVKVDGAGKVVSMDRDDGNSGDGVNNGVDAAKGSNAAGDFFKVDLSVLGDDPRLDVTVPLDNTSVRVHGSRDVAALAPEAGEPSRVADLLAAAGVAPVDVLYADRTDVPLIGSAAGAEIVARELKPVQVVVPGLSVEDSGLGSEKVSAVKVHGDVFARSENQVFCATDPAPLTMGYCGAPVIDPRGNITLGIVEGVVPRGAAAAGSIQEELADTTVFVESVDVLDVVRAVGSRAD